MSGDKNKIYLSIAAGVTVAHLEEMLGADKKIVRAMPNTPAQVGCGMTVISPNKNIDDEDVKKVKMLLSAVGMVQQMDEKFMSVATALHGSSPAYVYGRRRRKIRSDKTTGAYACRTGGCRQRRDGFVVRRTPGKVKG